MTKEACIDSKPILLVPRVALISTAQEIDLMRKARDNQVYLQKKLELAYKQSHEAFEEYKKRLEGS